MRPEQEPARHVEIGAIDQAPVLGGETLAPYARPGADGRPLHVLPAQAGRTVPYLSYGAGAYMARMVEWIVKSSAEPMELQAVYETDMSEGLKAMALEGHGLAFLPASSVRRDVQAGRLVRAAPPAQFELTMDVRIYRERPEPARHVRPAAQALWAFLQSGAVPSQPLLQA